ncbi:unnamed protein product, partial [Pylaiella littoralis]
GAHEGAGGEHDVSNRSYNAFLHGERHRRGQARQQSPRSARVGHRQHTRWLHTRPALHRRSPRGGFAGIYPPGSETE